MCEVDCIGCIAQQKGESCPWTTGRNNRQKACEHHHRRQSPTPGSPVSPSPLFRTRPGPFTADFACCSRLARFATGCGPPCPQVPCCTAGSRSQATASIRRGVCVAATGRPHGQPPWDLRCGLSRRLGRAFDRFIRIALRPLGLHVVDWFAALSSPRRLLRRSRPPCLPASASSPALSSAARVKRRILWTWAFDKGRIAGKAQPRAGGTIDRRTTSNRQRIPPLPV